MAQERRTLGPGAEIDSRADMVTILTYHSQNVRGNDLAHNDHLALAADLPALHHAGFRVLPLDHVLDWMDGMRADESVEQGVVLTFDDGCDLDVRDIDFPGFGLQRSFLGVMQDFVAGFPEDERPELHATCFVIASPEARRQIDAGSLFGQGWISDDWWREADAYDILSVENHGWDHNHPDLEGDRRGSFHTVDTHEQCMEQVVLAANLIQQHTGRRPRYFAYPFGESSAYIREVFFPDLPDVHGCRAALGTEPGSVGPETNRWNLPRYVCGRDWTSPGELVHLLGCCTA